MLGSLLFTKHVDSVLPCLRRMGKHDERVIDVVSTFSGSFAPNGTTRLVLIDKSRKAHVAWLDRLAFHVEIHVKVILFLLPRGVPSRLTSGKWRHFELAFKDLLSAGTQQLELGH